ncbi:GNAT family N-acetyltransferase [Aliinostoc sp. HNIBRCY26]|uniref:GNAT family N-acetyltransferase n=1 Tax=Aliinostoc sp. HNIBRCY26 TaxID=3418997 RepID=UPI003D012805
MVKIIKRKVTTSETKFLLKAIKLTPNIMGYSFREWMEAEHIMVAEDEAGKILGVCLNYDFHEYWNKIAALFVLEEFRGQGIGKLLFYESYQDAARRNKNVFTISANQIVIKMMQDLNFVLFNNLLDFPQVISQYRFTFYGHSLAWLMNFYRMQEIIRKTIVYSDRQNFVYGINLTHR